MDYTLCDANGQCFFDENNEFLLVPSSLYGFHNTETTKEVDKSGRSIYILHGLLNEQEGDRKCPICGAKMYVNSKHEIDIHHLNIGRAKTLVRFPHVQYRCSRKGCKHTATSCIPFKTEDHRITYELHQYVCDLLAHGEYSLKAISRITGLCINVVKDIDKARLKELYTVGGTKLIKPEQQATMLGIDEFLLHKGRQYATHIVDMSTGHILWIGKGRKKQIVYDFIEHVGMEWMKSVKAVACDMNSDFEEAFLEKCPWLKIVFDHFHIVKHLNDAINSIRRDEYKRLCENGDIEAANTLCGSKYILTSNRETLKRKDDEAANGRELRKESKLFGISSITRKGGHEDHYNKILAENELLSTADIVKEKLRHAYTHDNEYDMRVEINEIADICMYDVDNRHLRRFGKLLKDHIDGIITYATYHISTGKVEGINNRVKTLRRVGYGYPDDEYFFLKLIDMSRSKRK